MEAKKYWLRVERFCVAICLGLVANWFAFAIITTYLGGEAWSGHIEDGHYFLGSHGRYTETSRPVWEYTRMHRTFSMITIPLIPISLLTAGIVRDYRNGGGLFLRPPSPPV